MQKIIYSVYKASSLNSEEKTTLFGSQYWILQHNYQCFITEFKAFILIFWSFYINKGFITSWKIKDVCAAFMSWETDLCVNEEIVRYWFKNMKIKHNKNNKNKKQPPSAISLSSSLLLDIYSRTMKPNCFVLSS